MNVNLSSNINRTAFSARGAAGLGVCAVLVALASPPAFSGEDVKPVQPKQIQLNFKDMPLETVLEQLSEMAGLVIVKDVTVEGRISVISKQTINVDEAIQLLNSVLKEKGYVGIRSGRILKIVKLDEAKKRNIPVRTGSDPAKIADTDEVVTQVMPIRHIDAAQLKKDFTPLIPAYADLTANTGSNTLIMTDTSSNIKRVAEIIRAMDTQSTVVMEVKVFQLKYANAASAARLINETFKEEDNQRDQQQGRFGPGYFFGRGRGGDGRESTQTENTDDQAQKLRKVSASADDRTNTVVVSASPEVLPLVEKVIKELDSNPAEEQAVFMYRCKNAQAINLESVLNAVFGVSSGTVNRTANSRSTGTGQDVVRGGTTGRNTGVTGGGNTFGSGTGAGSGGSTFGGGQQPGGFGQSTGTGRSTGSRSAVPAGLGGDLVGQVYTVADVDTNSLIILTASKNFDRVKKIVSDLDKPVPQVFIKVLIAEVTHSKDTDVGVDASVLANGVVATALTDFGVVSQAGGLITQVLEGDFSATLRAIDKVGTLEILSRPYILASDNQLSSITVGQEVPFIVSSRTTETGQTINTIQYQDIGIILNVTAHINEDGLVILDVAPEVSSLTGNTVPISETVSAPVFAKRSALSRVGIPDGKTIVIGGLMEDRKTETETGVPILRKIPGLGALFRRKQTTKAKTELLIFLTPHVAQDPSQLKRMTQEEEARLKLVPDAVRPKAWPEHKEGMERRAEIVPEELSPKEKRRMDPASESLPIP